jgi:transposase
MALRERVVACVEEGYSHRLTAARFRVSVKFVNDMIILKRETGGLAPRAQGNGGGHGKLEAVKAAIGRRMTENPDLTLDDLVTELAERHGITIHRVSVWRLLRGLGLTHKKRSSSRRAEAARGSRGAPDMDHAAPALHAQPIAALGVH